MARSVSSSILTALQARVLVPRDFLWLTVKDRSTGAPFSYGLWTGLGPITVPVIDGTTGQTVNREYVGSGPLIGIGAVPLTNDMTVQTLTVTSSAIADAVQTDLRTYDADQAPVEIHRGLFDPSSRNLVDAAICRFVGFVDKIEITTAKEGSDSQAVMTLVSHSRETTRMNPAVRSDADQKLRLSTDTGCKYTAVGGDWIVFWGQKAAKISDVVNSSKYSDIAK